MRTHAMTATARASPIDRKRILPVTVNALHYICQIAVVNLLER